MNHLRRLKRLAPLVYLVPVAYLLQPLFWTPLEYRFYNYFHAQRAVEAWEEVVVIGIDRATRDEVLPVPAFPLSRHADLHAALVRELAAAGARAIVFDLGFQEGVFGSPPLHLARAFREYGSVFLVMSMYEKRTITPDGETILWQAEMPDSTLLAASRGAYLSQVRYDADGTLRRFYRDQRLDRLGIENIPEILSQVSLDDDVPIVFPSVERPIPTLSYGDVIAGDRGSLAAIQDRIAFVGLVEDPTTDMVNVPRPQLLSDGRTDWALPGVTTLAAITETLFHGAPVRDFSWPLVLAWNVFWSFLAIVIPPASRPRLAFFSACAIGAVAMAVTGLVNIYLDRLFPAGLLFGCLFVCGLHASIAAHLATTKALHVEEIENARVQHEMVAARRTQKRFLPKSLPDIKGMTFWGTNLSSLEVSGDYYDVIDLGSDRPVVLAIGDVSGKGMAASLLMSNVQAGLHTLVHAKNHDIGAIAENLNHLVWQNTEVDKFVTFFLAELDKSSRMLRYVRAGHDLPFIISSDGKIRKLEQGSLIFGLMSDVPYPVETAQLMLGDVLCLYTDGITEAFNPMEEEFGVERLVESVRADRHETAEVIGKQILQAVDDFTGQAKRADDMTLIILHV